MMKDLSSVLYTRLATEQEESDDSSLGDIEHKDSFKNGRMSTNQASSSSFTQNFETTSALDSEKKEDVLCKMTKDILLISFAFFSFQLCYISYIYNLKTLFEENLAFDTLIVLYASEIIASLFLPTLLVRRLGCKPVIVLAGTTPVFFAIAEFYPSYWTFIPSSILLGAGFVCIWVALATYLTNVCKVYCTLNSSTLDGALGFCFGIVNLSGSLGGILGYIINEEILNSRFEERLMSGYYRFTFNETYSCGSKYCHNSDENSAGVKMSNLLLKKSGDRDKIILFVIYIVIGIVGSGCSALFLNRRQELEENMRALKSSIFSEAVATIAVLRNMTLVLLAVSFFAIELVMSFGFGVYTKAYAECPFGSGFVSFVAVAALILFGISAFASGSLVTFCGIIGTMLVVNLFTEITLYQILNWVPGYPKGGYFDIVLASAILGAFAGTSSTTLNILCGVVSHSCREAAFAFGCLFSCVAALVSLFIADYLCTIVMTKIIMAIILIGTVLHVVSNHLWRSHSKTEGNDIFSDSRS